jgi:hypothetical protein
MSEGKPISVSFDRSACCFVGLTPAIMSQLYVLFPGVNVDKELLVMSQWMLVKGKDIKGSLSFIMNWLDRVKPNPAAQSVLPDPTISHLLNDYLEDLWKNNSHIYEFNKMPTS